MPGQALDDLLADVMRTEPAATAELTRGSPANLALSAPMQTTQH
jgi:hypothetical protein